MSKQHITDQGDIKKYFHILPNLADEGDLTPEEYRLLGHYVRRGECYEGIRTTAKVCRMNKNTVTSVRQSLVEKGWIEVQERQDGGLTITVLDRWAENVSYYGALSQTRAQAVPFEGTATVPNEGTKEEPIEEEPTKKSSGADAPRFSKADYAQAWDAVQEMYFEYWSNMRPSQVQKIATRLLEHGLLEAHYPLAAAFRGWHRNKWWRGLKGELPNPAYFFEEWPQFMGFNAPRPNEPRAVELDERTKELAQMIRQQRGISDG